MEDLSYLKEFRGMTWIRQNMRVDVDGITGSVAGGFGGNVAVKFPDRDWVENCHPFWHTIYYNDDGTVIRDYYKEQGWVADGRDLTERRKESAKEKQV